MFAGTVVVMGVSGTGKTEVASRLATRLGRAFIEADRLHSPANLAKMAGGEGLTDADRWPWLAEVAAAVNEEPRQAIVACSALRRAYRDFLRGQLGGTWLSSSTVRLRSFGRVWKPVRDTSSRPRCSTASCLRSRRRKRTRTFVVADIRQIPGEIVEAVVRTLSGASTPPGPQR